jgi:hypothetical protein
MLPPQRTGQLSFSRTASALKTSLTLYESWGGNSIIFHATKLNFWKTKWKISSIPKILTHWKIKLGTHTTKLRLNFWLFEPRYDGEF